MSPYDLRNLFDLLANEALEHSVRSPRFSEYTDIYTVIPKDRADYTSKTCSSNVQAKYAR
jgi:hypothetical protein